MKKMVALLLVLMLAFGLVACSSGGDNGDNGDGGGGEEGLTGHLVIYTSEPQDLVTEMLEAFIAANPGVTYELFRSGTGDVKAKLDTELQAGGTDADLIWFADIGYMYNLDEQDLIMHYSPDAAADLPDDYKYNDGMGHEVRAIYAAIAYNTTKVTDPPKDWDDITTEDYRGVVALANPNYSGGAFTTLMAHIQNEDLVGWEWYNKLKAIDAKMEQSNGTLSTKVASGEYEAVVVIDYLPRNAKKDGSPVDYIYPASGAVMVPTPLCIMNTIEEENVEAAKALVDFMFTTDNQKLFVDQGYVPMNSAAAEGTDVPTIDEIEVMPFDLEFYVENSDAVRQEYVRLFGAE
ncbi:extracellular solute-binding protein [Alkalibacter rhizosphaerae]|uniref:Extracellular solute-binding protein n=1 Tax=Alkalibacter rhizosphaerae TaxID=2815577 RepID=A0A974XFA5_9FIRM|nr:extracellular solute-binding protein [Alkalibacter rhizosphaerae]QSX08696.1 extracellular solute-binding protein [Alkalibacter rhizosphaerae]